MVDWVQGRKAWERKTAHITAAGKQNRVGWDVSERYTLQRHAHSDPPPRRLYLLTAQSAMNIIQPPQYSVIPPEVS